MQNVTEIPTFSPLDRIRSLTRAIDFCKTFINAKSCTTINILIDVKDTNNCRMLRALPFGKEFPLPVPSEAFFNFFFELAQTLTEERLRLLIENPEACEQ